MTAPGHLTHTGSEGVWYSAKRDDIAGYTPASPKPFAFEIGDEVIVVNEDSIFNGATGKVTNRWEGTPHRYTVKLPHGSSAIFGFMEHHLRKVNKKTSAAPMTALMVLPIVKPAASLPTRKRPDIFFSVWGKYDLTKHADIPRRFAAYRTRAMKKRVITPPVIYLPAVCKTTRVEIAHRMVQELVARYEQEDLFVASLDRPQTQIKPRISRQKRRKVDHSAKAPKQRQQARKPREMPKMRIRRYAA